MVKTVKISGMDALIEAVTIPDPEPTPEETPEVVEEAPKSVRKRTTKK